MKMFLFRCRPERILQCSASVFNLHCSLGTVGKEMVASLERQALVGFSSEASVERLERAIQFADQLAQVDTAQVDPLVCTVDNRNQSMREDCVLEESNRPELMGVAPVQEEFYYVAPLGVFSRNRDKESR